jgi:hypothetical protein
MNTKKPEPLILLQPQRGKTCPVCGKPSYSRGGVHPQCCVKQADEPRQLQLAEAKRKARLEAEGGDVEKAQRPRPVVKRMKATT